MSATFSDYTQNLGEFLKSRPKSGVRFLYFNATDLTTPRVNASFGQWKVRNTQCYVAPGNGPNYCYVFRKSPIRYLVRLHKAATSQRGSATFYTADFKGTADPKVDVYHGDHLTFGVVKSSRFGVQLDTHYTVYHEDATAPFTFLRSVLACQMAPPPIAHTKTLEAFSASQCSLAKTTTIKDQYSSDPFIVEMVYNLYKVIHDYPASSAARCTVPGGAAGAAGATAGGAAVEYKGVTFISDGFIRFLSNTIFAPLYRLRPDLSGVQVIFDEMNELGDDANRTIVLMYDFEEYTRNIYYLEMETAFAAAYAYDHPTTANAYEKNCLREFLRDVQHPETGLAAVAGQGGGRGAPLKANRRRSSKCRPTSRS